MKVTVRASRELMEWVLDFGDRRILAVDVGPEDVEGPQLLIFTVEDPHAPEGATEMAPRYHRQADHTVRMLDPGYIIGERAQ